MRKLDVIVREFSIEDDKISIEFPGEAIANMIRTRIAYTMREKHPESRLFFLSWDDEHPVPVGAKIGEYEVDGKYQGFLHDSNGTEFGAFDHVMQYGEGRCHEMIVAVLES